MTQRNSDGTSLENAEPANAALDRRQMLTGVGAAIAATAAARSAFAEHHEAGRAHASGVPYHTDLVEAALHCVRTGEDCLRHCLETFQHGDTSLSLCAVRVRELAVSCEALANLAAHDSEHLKAFAEATIAVCETCEAECRKHEHHEPCKTCANSCRPCIEQCKKVTA